MIQEITVKSGHIGTGGTIHKYGIEYVHPDDLIMQYLNVAGWGILQLLAVCIQVNALTAEHSLAAACNTHHIQLEPALLHQFFALSAYLLQQTAAHGTHTTDKEVEHLILGQEERVMDYVERLAQ